MKTAVSIPDEVYRQAEELAGRTHRSRSKLYSDALAEYLARHGTDSVTQAMNEALAATDEHPDAFVSRAAHATLKNTAW